MKRKTISKRFGAKLRVYNEWLKSNRTLTTPEIMLKTAAKLQGHYGCYGVTRTTAIPPVFHKTVMNRS